MGILSLHLLLHRQPRSSARPIFERCNLLRQLFRAQQRARRAALVVGRKHCRRSRLRPLQRDAQRRKGQRRERQLSAWHSRCGYVRQRCNQSRKLRRKRLFGYRFRACRQLQRRLRPRLFLRRRLLPEHRVGRQRRRSYDQRLRPNAPIVGHPHAARMERRRPR